MALHDRRYKFTNVVDMMLSNPMGRPESKPLQIDARTGETITLNHLRHLVGAIHAGLRRFGLNKGDTVCLYSPNNINMAPIYMGTMAAGMTISPANTSYVSAELQRQLTVGEAKILIAHPVNLETALDAAAAVGMPRSHVFSIVPDPKQRVRYYRDVLVDHLQPELPPIKMTHEESINTVAYLCFSSGTTGRSKGVMTSHYNVIAMVLETNNYAGIFADPTVSSTSLAVIPLYHFSGISSFFNMGIPAGSTTVILEKYSVRAMCEAIQTFKVTSLPVAPPIVIHLVNRPEVKEYDLSSLERVGTGSAPIAASVVTRCQEKFKVYVGQGYGMTEVSPVITYQMPEWAKPDSIGRVIPIMNSKIIDSEGREVGLGEPGELCVQGPNVMLGYKGDPEATANAIDKDNWLHTGDIVKKDADGNLYIVDRIKELIKYKGFQVAPVELESVLLQCPYVSDAGVIGIDDESQGTEVPMAFVTLPEKLKGQGNSGVLAKKIEEWVDERVANHKRLRGGVRIIDEIPKSEAGKILRKDMKDIYKKQQQQLGERASRL
ncbi:hypothetical protein BDB00DRAFT_871993 [Zychaea mexicana]|uniref:uncharacterized protein n=1 Tax=Zychaea mexicana TaxID=64656 RepID=UPI0022FEE59C|nr:uncharacterized protein BDB00DRAFT_871993 [Zychaea mexicana]KAI9493746.1 hypothetical protein BDB00DRAFT_871993 [Zychaea mexicana]